MGVKFADKAATTITGDIAADATSVTVSSASGFPDVTGAGDFFYATLERANDTTTYEVVKVTNLSSTTYTIDRSIDSSSTFSTGDTFALRLNEHAIVDPSLLQAGITTDTLTVDNVIINGTTIGHTDDTDLLTLTANTLTVAGEVDATSLDISGNADIDGTLEADAITVNGVTLAETISDTVGAMVGSNTETGITVTYDDSDNTLDFVVGTLNQDTTGTAALATEVTISANNSTDETIFPVFVDGATGSQGLETDTGFTYNPSTGLLTATGFSGNLTGTLQTAAQTNITSVGNLTALNVNGTVTADGLNVDTSNSFATINVGTAYLDVIGTDATSGLRLSNTNNTTAGQSDILFQRTENPVVNGANTGIGQMLFEADNSGGSPFLFADMTVYADQFTAGSEEAFVNFHVEDGTGSRNEKLRVNKDGITVTGTVTADALTMGDSEKITLGTGGDLEIYHSGSHSIIDEKGTGNLLIKADDLVLEDTNGNNFIKGTEGGTVQIWHNAASHATAKLSTAATGIDVLGTITADGITNAGAIANTGTLENTGDVTIKSTSTADANTPTLTLERTVDDADGDTFHDLGNILAKGVDLADTSNRHNYAEIAFNAAIETAGNETGRITFKTCNSGNNFGSEVASVRGDAFYAKDSIVVQTDGGTNRFTKLKSVHTDDSTTYTVNLPSASGTLALQNADTTGNAATATVAKGAAVIHSQSTDGSTIGHATVAGYVGKTVVYTNTGDSSSLTLGVPQCTEDVAVGEQIHLVNASTGSGASAKIIFDLNESGDAQNINICTGATVVDTGTDDPHIVAGGVATLVAVAANEWILFGSGVVDN